MTGKRLSVLLVACTALVAWADGNSAARVQIGSETWYESDATKPLPYVFSCGAVLNSTEGGVRLDLNNVALPSKVWVDGGDLSVLLAGDNYSNGGIEIQSNIYKLSIFGPGSLVISNPSYSAIGAGEVSIAAGAAITIIYGDSGHYGAIHSNNKLSICNSAVSIYSEGAGILANSLDIIGSVVVEKCPSSGILNVPDSVVIDASVVCVYSSGKYVTGPVSLFSCTHSYFSSVSCGSHALNAYSAFFDHSIVKLYDRNGQGMDATSANFGEGEYYIASGMDYEPAVNLGNVNIDGGNVQVCASGENSMAIEARQFTIDSGRFEIVDRIDVKKFLLYDAAAAAVATGASFGGLINPAELIGNFYSGVLLDAVSNGKIGDLEGCPYAGIRCGAYRQTGGTVWCDKAEYGVLAYETDNLVIVDGGSCKGRFFDDIWNSSIESYQPISAASSKTTATLKCAPYAVDGAKKYDKIAKNWDGILPSYYKTNSLYADDEGKLYFWVPAGWNIPDGEIDDVTQVNVSFDAQGGFLPAGSFRNVNSGAAVGTLPVPVRDGYDFLGWFTAAAGGVQISSGTMVAGDVTYYAHWKAAGGESGSGNHDSILGDMHELFEVVGGVVPVGVASVYDGFLMSASGNVAGTVQVKVAKPKNGKAKATVTIQPAIGNKVVVNGTLDVSSGKVEGIDMALGADGMSGTWNGYAISGSRNFFTSKDKSEQGAANDLLAKWQGAVNVVWDGGSASVSIAKKGRAKVSATLADGTKAAANAQLLVGEKMLCVPVVVTKKANLAFALWLPLGEGRAVVEGLGDSALVGKPGALGTGAAFRLGAAEFSAAFGQTVLPYLPDGVAVTQSGAKWSLPKAGKVSYKDGAVDETKLGENPSGLKLTYKAKDGSFKGSFKVYAVDGGKAKATTVNVAGLLLDGVGYGTATIKGKGSVAATIK